MSLFTKIPPFPLPLADEPATTAGAPARWIRPPANGETCDFTGLGHASFYGKLLGDFSETFVHVNLRSRGETRGTQLIFAPSLHRLLLGLAGNGPSIPDLIRTRFDEARITVVEHRWMRAPVNGQYCTFTGLSHGAFYKLLESAGQDIAVSQLKSPGESRASRLVWIPSLHEYLLSLAEEQVGHL